MKNIPITHIVDRNHDPRPRVTLIDLSRRDIPSQLAQLLNAMGFGIAECTSQRGRQRLTSYILVDRSSDSMAFANQIDEPFIYLSRPASSIRALKDEVKNNKLDILHAHFLGETRLHTPRASAFDCALMQAKTALSA